MSSIVFWSVVGGSAIDIALFVAGFAWIVHRRISGRSDLFSDSIKEQTPIHEGGCSRCRPVCYPLRHGERIPQSLGNGCCR